MSFKQYVCGMAAITCMGIVSIALMLSMGVTSAEAGVKESWQTADPMNCILATVVVALVGLGIVIKRHHKARGERLD